MRYCFPLSILLFIVAPSEGKGQLCFVLNRLATVRRDSIGVVSATSQVHCNIRCVETPGCDACMYYEDKGNCVLLGVAKASPPGPCGAPYTCYERRTSGCPVYSAPMVDRGYTPGPCSRLSDAVGPPNIGTNGRINGLKSCGNAFVKVVLDAELHDGTRLVLENEIDSFVYWDDFLGSWYYYLKGTSYYFKNAKCVRPPATALAPACECIPIPYEQPMLPGAIPDPIAKPRIDTIPICTTGRMQVYYKRSSASGWILTWSGSCYLTYCAMGELINVFECGGIRNEATILATTCIQ